MDSFFSRHKNATILFVVLAAQIIGLASQIKRENGSVRLIQKWIIAAVTPFEKGIVHSEQWMHKTWDDYFYLRRVRRDNRELREQIAQMKLAEVRMQQDAAQARRLQALFEFKEQYISQTIAAQVIGSGGSEMSHIVYIDRGSRDGIQPNMAVITPAGIVGKVLHVFPTTAQVLEISDQSSGVGAALSQSRLQGILKGQPSGDPNLAYVMADEKVTPGEEAVTSGGDRIFPKGLPIGKVVSVDSGKDLFLNIRIKPAADLDRLEEVLVITKIEEKAPDTNGLGPIRASDILAERLPSVPDKAAAPTGTPSPNASVVTTPAGAQASGKQPVGTGTRPAASTGAATASGANSSGVGASATPARSGASLPANLPAKPSAKPLANPPAFANPSAKQQPAPPAKPANAAGVLGKAIKPGSAVNPEPDASAGTNPARANKSGAASAEQPPKRKQAPPEAAVSNGSSTPSGENAQAH